MNLSQGSRQEQLLPPCFEGDLQVTLELGELQRCQGGNQPRRMGQAVTKEEKVFSPWDLEIKTGLRIVMRKEEGVGAKTVLKVSAAG